MDGVAPAARRPKTVPLGEALGTEDLLALGGDPTLPVLADVQCDPLLAAVHVAFAEHRPLVLSPDAIWLTILRGLTHHVRLHAEELREVLGVRHEGHEVLRVETSELPRDDAGWIGSLTSALRARLEGRVKGPARLFACDFSTSTETERVAGEVMLLDVYSAYFRFEYACVCGIPTITVEGTPEDWRRIGERIDVLAEWGLGFWAPSLRRIATELRRASEGSPDRAFFRGIYKPRDAYGEEVITGWVARLYPYLASNGMIRARNPLLEHDVDRPVAGEAQHGWWKGPGIRTSDVPILHGTADVRVITPTEERDVVLEAGLGAVEVTSRGALVPRAFFRARRGRSLSRDVHERDARTRRLVDAIVARHEHEPTTDPPLEIFGDPFRPLWSVLRKATIHGAVLEGRDPKGAWSSLSVTVTGAPESLGDVEHPMPVVRLPDGAILAHGGHGWVRLDAGQVEDRRVLPPASEVPTLDVDLPDVLEWLLEGRAAPLPQGPSLWARLTDDERRRAELSVPMERESRLRLAAKLAAEGQKR